MRNNIKSAELPTMGRQKSFYGKALVIWENDTIYLKSYDTIVCSIHDNLITRMWNGYSATTMKHVNAFLKFMGFDHVGGKAYWDTLPIDKPVKIVEQW